MSDYKPFEMKGSAFYGKPKSTKSVSKPANEPDSPLKGFFGKLLNPMQMLPGKLGALAGKLPGSNL